MLVAVGAKPNERTHDYNYLLPNFASGLYAEPKYMKYNPLPVQQPLNSNNSCNHHYMDLHSLGLHRYCPLSCSKIGWWKVGDNHQYD
jgi:hypothetical protein